MQKLTHTWIILTLSLLFYSCDEGGVRASNNMEKYALDYIAEQELLTEEESILAYYDYTFSLDGTEAVILTDERLIYHNKETSNTTIKLENINDIQHRQESLIGDIIEVISNDGIIILIEIAPANNGETFLRALKSKLAQE